MKLSIWKQFSSNHSANFTTVAQFESADWALEAFHEIHEMMRNIAWWHEHFHKGDNAIAEFHKLLKDPLKSLTVPKIFSESEFIQFLANYNPNHPETVAEAFYQQVYDVSEWRKPLDWVHERSIVKDIEIYQDLVIISPFASTWAGAEPFHSIMRKLGARYILGTKKAGIFVLILIAKPQVWRLQKRLSKK